MNTESKKNFKEVEKAFSKLDYLFSTLHYGQYGKQYFSLCLNEEKNHLKGKPEGCFHGMTVLQGGKYFFVKYLVDFLYFKDKLPTIKEVLRLRPSYIFSATLCENYPDEIKKALEGINIEFIHSLDYVELVKE